MNASATAVDEPSGYEQLYGAHHARVARLCRLLLADAHEADDVTQEIFLKLFQTYQRGEAQIAWGPWLTRVTVNACRDRRRSGWWKWWRERHQEFVEPQVAAAGPSPEEEVLGYERRDQVWRAFRRLSARQQEVFVLRQIEGWPTEEVAAALQVSPGSVKRHLYRAVHQLRAALRGRL